MSEAITRRRLLQTATVATAGASFATMPIAGVLASAEADPVFVAIEAHRATCAAFVALLDEEPTRAAGEAAKKEWGAEYERINEQEWNTAWAILDLEPATIGGVITVLRYIVEHSDHGRNGWPERAGDPEIGESKFMGASFENDAIEWAALSLERLTTAA